MNTNSTINILVVEDTRIYRESFCELLQSCFPQARIRAAEDGTSALSLTRRHQFDLIILDYQLKSITGGDVVRHLRQRASLTGTAMPVIVVMSSQPDISIFARTMGAAAFLGKPVFADDIENTLGPILAKIAAAAQPDGSNPTAAPDTPPQPAWSPRSAGTRPLLWRVRSRTVG
jgi:CheY-like chemotaxis protein